MLPLIALSFLAVAHPVKRSEWQLRQVDYSRERCKQTINDPSPTDLQSCDGKAITAYSAIVKRAKNAEFKVLLSDLFEPLLFRSTGREDAVAMRVTVLLAEADFARTRAGILTGAHSTVFQSARPKSARFGWIEDTSLRADFGLRWSHIRDRDCQLYQVPNCRTQLDGALAVLVEKLSPIR